MLIAVPKETTLHETRVALVPKHVADFIASGIKVQVEKNAGQCAGFSNEDYQQAGAKICKTAAETYRQADIIVKICPPQENELKNYSSNQTLICNMQYENLQKKIQAYSKAKLNLFALDLIPRIFRAQNMDVLSSQNNLDGYMAAVLGAANCPNIFPLMITAAGTIPPIKVFIMGLGVAGLQAAATANRLGAQVYAYDTRAETEEQAKSIGAIFIKDTTTEFLNSLQLIITAAQIKGKPAPKLLTKEQLKALSPCCVIVDLAAAGGGNIDKQHLPQNIKLIQDSYLARHVPHSASILYSNNIYNFCHLLIKDNQLRPDFKDEIIRNTLICCHSPFCHPHLTGE